jgi:hypothetical protein
LAKLQRRFKNAKTGLATTHPPARRSALIEVGETIAASVTLFARVSGYAPCFARAIALVAFTSVGKEQLQQVLLPKVKAV